MSLLKDEVRSIIISIFSGVTSGLLYTLIYVIFLFINVKNSPKNSTKTHQFNDKSVIEIIVNVIKNVIFFSLSAVYFKLLCFYFNLPNMRAYMGCCFLIGLALYIKSFHKLFAIFLNVVYNKINVTLKKVINALKLHLKSIKDKLNERRKKTQSVVCSGVGRNNVVIHINNNTRLPNSRHILKKKQNKGSRRRNYATLRAN